MIVDLKLPPGMVANGTPYSRAGRWIDGNHVRFTRDTVRPMRGWQPLRDNAGNTISVNGRARALLTWYGANGQAQLVIGTVDGLFSWSNRTLVDIAPTDLVEGVVDSGDVAGTYGTGNYGSGSYGTGSGTTFAPASVWHLDTFGDYLVACLPSDGRILLWNRNPANDAAVINANAPTNCWGVVVTPERIVMGLGVDGDRRRVEWCDQEDYTRWDAANPAPGSQAGFFTLDGQGAIMAGRRGNRETLIWTTHELFAARYLGETFVYGFELLGSNCGAISPRCMAVVGSRAVWMGRENFYVYDGYARPLPCEVADRVFGNFERSQEMKVDCFTRADYNEIWWLYPSLGQTENDRYVVWNWEENWWATGSFPIGRRTAGCDRGPFPYPFMVAENGTVYEHEAGWSRVDLVEGGSGEQAVYIESAPIQIADGDRLMEVTYFIPDQNRSSALRVSAFTALWPDAPETERGPYSMTDPTSVRWTARQIRLRVSQRTDRAVEDWRFGVVRLDGRPGGRR